MLLRRRSWLVRGALVATAALILLIIVAFVAGEGSSGEAAYAAFLYAGFLSLLVCVLWLAVVIRWVALSALRRRR